MRERTEKVTIRLTEKQLRAIDFLVRVEDFPSRSEAIRTAIRDLIYMRTPLVLERVKEIRNMEEVMAEAEQYEREYLTK